MVVDDRGHGFGCLPATSCRKVVRAPNTTPKSSYSSAEITKLGQGPPVTPRQEGHQISNSGPMSKLTVVTLAEEYLQPSVCRMQRIFRGRRYLRPV